MFKRHIRYPHGRVNALRGKKRTNNSPINHERIFIKASARLEIGLHATMLFAKPAQTISTRTNVIAPSAKNFFPAGGLFEEATGITI
jgi:hypothetical protein